MDSPVSKVVGIVFTVLALATPAGAVTTWNLDGAGGDIGTSATFDSLPGGTSLGVGGFAATNGITNSIKAGDPLRLHQNSAGLGIIGGGFAGACSTTDIDECDAAEFVRFVFPTAEWAAVSLTMTGLDATDNWLIYGDNDGDLLNGATLLASGTGTSGVLTVNLEGTAPFQFLYLRPADEGDCTTYRRCGGTSSPERNDEFRVIQVQGELLTNGGRQAAVVEPGTVILLGLGLTALAAGASRLRRRASPGLRRAGSR